VAIVVVVVVLVLVVVVVDYEINPNTVYTANGLECFRTGHSHSGDDRKLQQTGVSGFPSNATLV
jgi:hypothetical protein